VHSTADQESGYPMHGRKRGIFRRGPRGQAEKGQPAQFIRRHLEGAINALQPDPVVLSKKAVPGLAKTRRRVSRVSEQH
jgi:hypothetical protein